MRFWKYHGCGNDFIIVDKLELGYITVAPLAIKMCNRYTGIGADGFIVVQKDPPTMTFYNQDGSEGTMCGNGIRCVARYIYEQGIIKEKGFSIQTKVGLKPVSLASITPFIVKVDMGIPFFDDDHLHLTNKQYPFLDQKVIIEETAIRLNCVFIGTHHTVIWTDCLEKSISTNIGNRLCNHALFENQSNIDFVQRIDHNTFVMQTYERGVGFTKACGTGACAAYVIGRLQGKCDETVSIYFEEGVLEITQEGGHIIMKGPAIYIANGIYYEA